MSDQASELRSRWRALAPSVREGIIRTGRADEPEAQWIAVNYARMRLGRVRRRFRVLLLLYIVVLGTALGLLRGSGVIGPAGVPVAAAVITIPSVLGLFAWMRGQVIAYSRIITVNEAAPVLEGAGPGPGLVPGRGEALAVRVVPGRLILRFGLTSLVLVVVGAVMLAVERSVSTAVTCWTASVLVLFLLGWALARIRRHNPLVTLSEDGVTVAGWRTTVPWSRITGI
ncbi:hypothetical protein AB0J52_23540, partial [Spirillospora sp. NPDC049652]